MSYIPSKAMPHPSKRKPAPADAPTWRAGAGRVKKLLGGHSGKLGLLGVLSAAVIVPLFLTKSTTKR